MSTTPNSRGKAEGTSSAKPRRRRWPRIVGIAAILLLLVLGLLVAFAPSIASSVAPGIVQEAASESIKGSVKVERISLSWGGPTIIGPIELYDDTGAFVGRVQAETDVGLWTIVSERWWSKKQLDVGTIELTGKLDVVRAKDGSSNLERAIEPTAPQTAGTPQGGATTQGGGGLPFDSLSATLKVEGVDVTYTDKSPSAEGTPMASGVGVNDFGGDIKIDYDAKGGRSKAVADLAGALQGVGPGAEKLTVKLDADVAQDAQQKVEAVDAAVNVSGAPVGLVDGIVGLGGELVDSVGPRADLRLSVDGTPDNATISMVAQAEGASADLGFVYADGILRASKPGTVHLRSTSFVAQLPSVKQSLASLDNQVRLGEMPGLDVTIDALSVPIPKSMLGLAPTSGAKGSLDLAAAAAKVDVRLGAISGQLNTGSLSGQGSEAPASFEPFSVEPVRISFESPRLAGQKRLTAATSASVAGKPAGRLDVDLTATGMFNAQGNFDLGALESAAGEARLAGVTTSLLQPLVSSTGLNLDLAQDVGPTIDLSLRPSTAPAANNAAAYPPTNLNLQVSSQNIRGGGDLRVDDGVITTTGDGIVVQVVSAGPAVSRILTPPADAPPGIELTGPLPVRLAVRDVRVNTTKQPLGIADIQARAEVQASDARIQLPPPEEGEPLGPVQLGQVSLTASLTPGQPATAQLDVAMSHDNAPFGVKGAFTADNLADAMGRKAGPIDQLVAAGLRGRLDVIDAPRSLLRVSPGAYAALRPTGTDTAAEVKRLIWRMIGPSVDVTLTTEPGQGSQGAKIDLATAGVTGSTTATVTPQQLSVQTLGAQARLVPSNVEAILASLTPTSATKPTLASEVTVLLSAEPLTVPFKAGTASPDLAKAGTAVAHVRTSGPILVSNLGIADRVEYVGLGDLKADARLPLAPMLAPEQSEHKTATLNAEASMNILRPGSSGWSQGAANATVAAGARAEAAIPLSAPPGAEQRFALRLNDVLTEQLSPLVGDPQLLPGALGDRLQLGANVAISGTEESGQRIALDANLEAPRVQGASIKGSTQGDVFRVDAANVTWTPTVDWMNRIVFKPADSAGVPVDQLVEPATFNLNVNSLVVSMPRTENETPVQGPLKPGVFNADLSFSSPRLVIKRPDGQTVRAEEIRVALTGGQRAGVIDLNAAIGRVASADGGAPSQGSSLRATLSNVADDKGLLTQNNIVADISGDLNAFPTPLVDALSGMNGKVVDLLGSTLDLDVTVQNVSASMDSGTISAKADSPRADAELRGVVRDKTFVQEGDFKVDIYEIIRYNIARKLPGGMPLVGFIEKEKGSDRPATVRAQGLRVPLDNDMRKLNGVVTVDPGTASFEFNDAFSRILRELSQRDRGKVGQRLEPFVVNIKDGVASYDKFRVKFGEFTLETTGSADLVRDRIDVVTYVPAGAVTEELLNLFKGSLGANAKGFTAETRFPFTTKGPLNNPSTQPDIALFIKENAGRLIEDVGGKAVEDLLKRLKGDK